MKITFAYRSGYVPNNRHLREFEAESVLSWFVQNWPVLSAPSNSEQASEALQTLLGVRPYGLPVSDHDDETPVAAPRSLKELTEKLEAFTYNNEVLVSKHCAQVLTDDDEIELAWYVFDEEYAQQNAAKISIWQHPDLPLQFGDASHQEALKSKKVLPAGTERGQLYWMSSAIHDSMNLEDLEGAYRFEGVRLPELLDYLRDSATISARGDEGYGLADLRLVQRLCKLFPAHDQQQIFEELANCQTVKLDAVASEDIAGLSLEEVRQMQASGATPDSARVVCGEHLVEVITQDSEVHDYLVLFDDLWLAANPELGQSLIRFCSTWKI